MWQWFKHTILGVEPTLDKAIAGVHSIIADIENVASFHAIKAEAASVEAKAQLLVVETATKAHAEAAAVAANFKKLLNA